MKTRLVAIGNARAVRIPKAFLERSGIKEDVEIEVRGSQIVIQAVDRPRAGWADAFRRMAAAGDDALLDG